MNETALRAQLSLQTRTNVAQQFVTTHSTYPYQN